MAYITNLYPTPLTYWESFLNNITALPGTEIVRDTVNPLFMSHSLHIWTDGSQANQGVEISPTTIESSVGSLSFYCAAPAQKITLVAQAISVTSGLLQQQTITASADWQRITFNNLNFVYGDSIYAILQTETAGTYQFFMDGIQVESVPVASKFIYGGQPGVIWTGNPGDSPSVMTAEFGTSGSGAGHAGGSATTIDEGEIFITKAEGSNLGSSGDANPVPLSPIGVFTDFGIFELTDPDPAMTYVGWNNAGTSSGHTGYTRVYGLFYPPLDYPVSSGYLWRRAAFAAVGFQWASVAASQAQDFGWVQLEYSPVNDPTAPVPSAYDSPRALHTIVHPDRLNYITNPNFAVGTTGWSAIGTATLAIDTGKTAPVSEVIDETTEDGSTQSMKVTANANGDGAQISVTNLIPGDEYIVSCYLQVGTGIKDINLSCSGGFGSIIGSQYPYGGTNTAGYGQGPYGGTTPSTDLTVNEWYRINFVFIASDSSVTLQITVSAGSDVSYPTYFWVGGVMCETGAILNPYFDGSFGTDYFWEGEISNGQVISAPNPGVSRSYYYNQYYPKSQAVANVMEKHTPIGLNSITPVFTQPPITS